METLDAHQELPGKPSPSSSSSGGSGSTQRHQGGLAEEEPQPGVVLKLVEVSGCELDACYAALVSCENNFHAALAKLRSSPASEEAGAKARAQMRAALHMLEQAYAGRSVTRGALGSAWIFGAMMLHAIEYVLPMRFIEFFLAILGVRRESPLGLMVLLVPLLTMLLAVVVLLRDLDGFLNSELSPTGDCG
eukprot:TRINITY_DN53404_c0_g1_i1.p1 TRINITY_DN53404_c0_g1~~TRINITY_DN53404_c0_g1_i1.p1  ORF type:complete len:204 (+),score=52.44 TRINITY_DN53404_c0_g1_i1:41-613(+)